METIRTSDFYYSDPDLEEFQAKFLLGRAQVNLLGFRRSYGELVSLAGKVKREYRKKDAAKPSTPLVPTEEPGLLGRPS